VNLARGEASSIGRLYQSARSVSMALIDEIEAVRPRILRHKKPDTAIDEALCLALQALNERRQKLLARLEKGNT
jgi:hypothetical protein